MFFKLNRLRSFIAYWTHLILSEARFSNVPSYECRTWKVEFVFQLPKKHSSRLNALLRRILRMFFNKWKLQNAFFVFVMVGGGGGRGDAFPKN